MNILKEYYKKQANHSKSVIAKSIDKSKSHISNVIKEIRVLSLEDKLIIYPMIYSELTHRQQLFVMDDLHEIQDRLTGGVKSIKRTISKLKRIV